MFSIARAAEKAYIIVPIAAETMRIKKAIMILLV
jgi:hypothetical protein